MDLVGRAVRIYGSQNRYGTGEREPPPLPHLSEVGFPERSDLVDVHFGPVPDEVVDWIRHWDVLADAMLDRQFRTAAGSLDDLVGARLASTPGRSFDDFPWYVTLVLERPMVVDAEPTESEFFWVEPAALEAVDDRFRTEGAQALDALAAVIAPALGPEFFEQRVERDRFMFVASDRPPVFYPRMSGSASLTVNKAMENFPAERLQERLAALPRLDHEGAATLGKVLSWYAAALTTADPWRRFQALAFALEILSNKLGRRLRPAVIEVFRQSSQGHDVPTALVEAVLWEEPRTPLVGWFANIAIALSPATAETDLAAFRDIKKARDALSHGQVVNEGTLPAPRADELLRRYINHALDRLTGAE